MSLFEVLQKVNVNCKNCGDKWTNMDRLIAIKELLSSSFYKRVNDDRELAHIYAKQPITKGKDYIVISTHVDTVPELTEFFTERLSNGQIKGTFDNALTNAVVVYNMLQNNNFGDNVIVAFTGDEENMETQTGAMHTMEYFETLGVNVSIYIVLDVTWDRHLGNIATVENIKLSAKNQLKLETAIKKMSAPPKVVPDNLFDDETNTYRRKECFSFCIPIFETNNMHSNNGCWVDENMLIGYASALTDLTKN